MDIATNPRCHLDRRERSHAAIIRPKKGLLSITRFLASLEMTTGVSSWPSPCRERGDFSLRFEMTAGWDQGPRPVGNDKISRCARNDSGVGPWPSPYREQTAAPRPPERSGGGSGGGAAIYIRLPAGGKILS